MPVKMAPHQLEFFRELLAPFDPSELSVTRRGGKELAYIDKRALENRLDSVCGPMGWYPRYEATSRGYKCTLWLLCPTFDPSAPWIWVGKDDGAGFEEMGSTNKKTGEWEADVDNDEKSGYTNALRRAAQDAWGIGRYLYNKGIPSFLNPNAKPLSSAFQEPATSSAAQNALAADRARQQAEPPKSSAPAAPAGVGNFRIPKPGKMVFAWAKEMEKTFEVELIRGMGSRGEDNGWGSTFASWNEEQVNTICMSAIEYVREQPTYKGQFEHLFPQGGAPAPKAEPKAQPAGVNIADLRKSVLAKMSELVEKQTGEKPKGNAVLKSVFETVASTAATREGHTGEIPESLSKMDDVVWLRNIIGLLDKQIAEAVTVPPSEEEDDIPF